jgi:hypothetical protein
MSHPVINLVSKRAKNRSIMTYISEKAITRKLETSGDALFQVLQERIAILAVAFVRSK